MVALNSKFDILRGWPNSSAVAEDFSIPAKNSTFKQGLWVSIKAGNTAGTAAVDALATSAAGVRPFLIIEGVDDYSSQFANRVTALMGGGYVVRIPESAVDSAGASYRCYANGKTAASFTLGQWAKATSGLLEDVAGQDGFTEVGQVVGVDAINGTIDLLVI